tara:strand:+ start:315 stop:890 length:576 start_codon:yes stop_codon:yes gene_type:complete
MNESLLKKEFKESDLQRARNLVKKDFTKKTKLGVGYQKSTKRHKEGDIWEDNGKTWTIKNGLKQNITKLDNAKKAIKIPLACPKCKGTMKYRLSKKMYKIHGFCYDCTIKYEAQLRKEGLYEAYEQSMVQGNMSAFVKDLEAWMVDQINTSENYVTEQGVIEDWKGNTEKVDKKFKDTIYEYIGFVKDNLK